jgi:DNA mismatch repair protein MSH2
VSFIDNDFFSILETAMIQTCSREVLFCPTGIEYVDKKIYDLFSKCNLTCTQRKKKDFSTKFEESVSQLEKVLAKSETPGFSNSKLVISLPCISAIVKYMELDSDINNFGYFHLTTMNLDQFMKLESTALKALNILKSPGESKTMSLYGLLDVCITKIGTRKLEEWIRQPLIQVDEIERRLDIVEAFVEDSSLLEKFRGTCLRAVPDLHTIMKRFQRVKGGLKDIVKMHYFLLSLDGIIETLESYTGQHQAAFENEFVIPLQEILMSFGVVIKLVQDCIDLDKIKRHEYLIVSGFDADLDVIREMKLGVEGEIESLRFELSERLNENVILEKKTQQGWVFKMSASQESDLEELIEGLEVISNKSKKICITCPRLRELSTEYDEITSKYIKQQSTIEEKITCVFATYIPLAEDLARIIVNLDILSGFAFVSINAPIPYVRPNVQEASVGRMSFKEARHPCLEQQQGVSFIPNSIEFNQNTKSFYVITGPNMSGKSTFIRQIAVITLMAQIGCFVPCSEALISIRESIFTRIGASDSQIRGVSTFMAEMLETSTILRSANQNSLVIIDELGRGTSTFEGYGLACKIAESIITKNKSFGVFATHFHELATLEFKFPQVGNKHVTAHVEKENIVMLYQVKEGHTDQSFGIHVGKLAKFPQLVIDLAEKRVRELESEERLSKKTKLVDPGTSKMILDRVVNFCRIDFGLGKDHILDSMERIFDPNK